MVYDHQPSREEQHECFICGEKDREKLAYCSWTKLFGHMEIRDCKRCHDKIIILAERLEPDNEDGFTAYGPAKKQIDELWNLDQELFQLYIMTGF